MKYLDWIDVVLAAMDQAASQYPSAALVGVDLRDLAAKLGLDGSNACLAAVNDAFDDLAIMGCAEHEGNRAKVTQPGQHIARGSGLRAVWKSLFDQCLLLEEDKEVLAKVVELGVVEAQENYATIKLVEMREALSALERVPDPGAAIAITKRLEGLGCIGQHPIITNGSCKVRPSYVGIVVATQQVPTELRALLNDLIETWETTSVDFKEVLRLDTDKEKAEFCKDIIALANTLVSGKSFLVVGFNDVSRDFTADVDPKCDQHRMESILAAYCKPVPMIAYTTVDWVSGTAGLIEVVCDRRLLPYRLSRDAWKFKATTVFVRHNTLVSVASSEEEQLLLDEAVRFRGTGAS